MKAGRDQTLISLRIILVASVLAPLLLFVYVARVSYRGAFDLADDRIHRSLDVVAAHAQEAFQSVAAITRSVDQLTADQSEEALRPRAVELAESFKQMREASPYVESIRLLGPTLAPIATSAAFPIPQALSGALRNGAVSQQNIGSMVQVGEVLLADVTALEFFPLWQVRHDETGALKSILEISLLPSSFESFFSRIGYNASASFSLLRTDGTVLARYPLPATPGIKLPPNAAFHQSVAQFPAGGQYTTVSGVDMVERRFAIRKLAGLPVYVSSSLSVGDIRDSWIRQMADYLMIGLPATLVMVALILLAMKRTRAFQREVERRQAAEASLRQSQKMEAIGQLTGGVAHDFNNLLTVIFGNLQLALRQDPQGKLHRYITNAMAGADRAAQLTKRLLAFSRNQPLDPQAVDANRLVAGMSDLLSRTLGEAIAIETVQSAGLWRIEADKVELESCLLNLAINARDAMPAGGKLTIETGNTFLDEKYCAGQEGLRPGQYVMIVVSDSGSGMPRDVLEKAFDPFFTTKGAGLGTGLGLSQVYGFVKQSNGHIRIYSELDQGTSVKIYLPRLFDVGEIAPAVEPSATPEGKGETILVVEDDGDVRSYTVETLTELGYKVEQAADGRQALLRLEAVKPVDLLLTDVVMPGMTGRDLADVVAERYPGLKVLFMTGYSRNAIVHDGRLDPGVLLIQKPFSQNQLALRIRGILDDVAA